MVVYWTQCPLLARSGPHIRLILSLARGRNEVEAEVFADHFAWVKRAAFAYFETLADFGISSLEV